jgi:hypothetical protein
MPILGDWICRSGIRRTTPGFVHDLSVKAEATNHVDRVEFAISANGSPHSTATASARAVRTPNFSDQPSPDPTVPSGQQKSFDGYGVSLNLSTVPAGTITVVATIFEVGGASYTLPDTITIYNDTDGGDRRPRTVGPFYVDSTSGNDANNGTSWAQAVKSPMRALQLGRSAGGEIGGLRINCRGTITNMSAGIFPECTTSGQWWCEWIADAAGCFLDPPDVLTARTLYSGQSGASASAVTCRHRWIGFRFSRRNCVSFTFGGIVEHWMDGCYQQATTYLGPNRVTVRYAYEGADGFFWGWNGGGASFPVGRRIFSQCDLRGALQGYQASSFLWDCRIRDFLGIACRIGSDAPRTTIGGLLMWYERYAPRSVEGFVRMDNDATQGKGRPAITVTKPTASTARITGPVGGYDFSIDAAALVGQTYWGLRFAGTGALGLDTTAAHIVTAVGNTGGAPWVEVTAPGAVAGSLPPNTASFWTAQALGSPVPGREYWYLHPDGIQVERPMARDIVFDCALVDARDLQPYFTSSVDSYDLDFCLWDNLRDDGSAASGMANNWNGSDCTNSILQRLAWSGQWQNTATASGWSGTIVRDCVFWELGGQASLIPSRGGTVDRCHIVNGSAFGTNGTTGPWVAGNPALSPFSMAPSSSNYGTGTAALAVPAVWRYGTTGATRGVLRNVGDLNWATGTTAPQIAANGPQGITATTATATFFAGARLAGPGGSVSTLRPTGGLMTGRTLLSPTEFPEVEMTAPTAGIVVGSSPAELAGLGASFTAATATGAVLAGRLIAANGPSGVTAAAPTGLVMRGGLIASNAPSGVTLAAPTGTVQIGVAIGANGPAGITAAAPTGALIRTPSIAGSIPSPVQARPGAGRLQVGEVQEAPPPAPRPRTSREQPRWWGALWGRGGPPRRWMR